MELKIYSAFSNQLRSRWEQQIRKGVMQMEEYETEVRRKSFRKAEVEGEAWLLDEPPKSGNVKERKQRRRRRYEIWIQDKYSITYL